MNDSINTAAAYHWATTHVRNRIKSHFLDFQTYPDPVKSYAFLNKISLIRRSSNLDLDLRAVCHGHHKDGLKHLPDLDAISRVLFLAYGVTRAAHAGGVPFFFRTVPSAGGLYPCHLYIAVQDVEGLETGLYYCNMIQEFLGLIQKGRPRTGSKKESSVLFFITGLFYTSAWKYRERAFRYILLDSGHLTESLALALGALGNRFSLDYDFDDEKVIKFLSLDPVEEVPLACLTIGSGREALNGPTAPEPVLSGLKARQRASRAAVHRYPLLQRVYQIGTPVVRGNDAPAQIHSVITGQTGETIRFSDVGKGSDKISYTDAVSHRRSKRNFVPEILSMNKAIDLIRMTVCGLFGADTPAGQSHAYPEVGVTCQNVQGLADGFYLLSRDRTSLAQIRKGAFQTALSRVCLDQKWVRHAALNFLFMANLADLEKTAGPRGYRHLLMQAGRLAQRIYLSAAGLGLGCCGVGALYDEEARDLFELNKDGALFYVVSAGPVKK